MLQQNEINAEMKRPKRVAVFSSTHHFNNSSVRVLACVYCSFSFHYFFLEELVLCVLHVLPNKPSNLKPSKPSKTVKPKPFWKYPFWKNMTIHVLETQQTHQNKRSKQWNQNQDRSHQSEIKPIKLIWKNQNRSTHQTHMKPKPNQTHQTDLPIKPTANQPIKPTADQPIHHHRVPKSRN